MKKNIIDNVAIFSSILCVFHCFLLPFIITLSTWSSLQYLQNPLIEWIFIVIGGILAFFSLKRSHKNHKNSSPIIIALIGFAILLISRVEFAHLYEVVLTCLGATLLIIAHWKNIKYMNSFLN